MHSFHVVPMLVLVKSESSHTISAVFVLELLHFDEQGEFGVTDRARIGWTLAKRRRSNKDKEWTAISNGLCVG